MGVSSVLLMRGDDLPDQHQPKVKQVFELSGKDLIETARELADDPGVTSVPDFFIGTTATVFSPRKDWKPSTLLSKVDAGAHFGTQIERGVPEDVPLVGIDDVLCKLQAETAQRTELLVADPPQPLRDLEFDFRIGGEDRPGFASIPNR